MVIQRGSKLSAGQASEFWPVLLLLTTVVVPTIALLWFLSVAVRNEQLASKQRLTDAYRSQLTQVQQRLDDYWERLGLSVIAPPGEQIAPARQFAKAVTSELADALVIYDADGKLLYPALPTSGSDRDFQDPRWRQAEQMEHEFKDLLTAAGLYRAIADDVPRPAEKAHALQAQARCLFKAGHFAEGIERIQSLSADSSLATTRDSDQRLIVPNVELMAIEFEDRVPSDSSASLAAVEVLTTRLEQRLLDYDETDLLPSQRLFLMNRLVELRPKSFDFPTRSAEALAADFVAAHPRPSRDRQLQRSQLADVWQISALDDRFVMLFRTSSVIARCVQAIGGTPLPESVDVRLLAPSQRPPSTELLGSAAAVCLPGWRLSLSPQDPHEFNRLLGQQRILHLGIGGIVVASTFILAFAIARALRRQLRLANLKNDIVGTVSHELKTPLASMRLLVDTLLDGRQLNEPQSRDYLQLIAKENLRLSRLIDNFLTFSRMEQGKQVFDFCDVSLHDLVVQASQAAGDRLQGPDCNVVVDVPAELPRVSGDPDALVRVLLNLLDNAYKYSEAPREIGIRASTEGNYVRLTVSDNGIGMSRATTRRVFQKFFQADQRLTRAGHGCGLGLSIVQYIVRAHAGSISVESRPGQGSTFTIRLPSARPADVASQRTLGL
jgi:signal transduction histidine kinase